MEAAHDPTRLLEERENFTKRLSESPYSCIVYLKRAECHEQLRYPDLAAGDVYRALLLIDEISDESGEYHEQALAAFEEDLRNDKQALARHSNGDEHFSVDASVSVYQLICLIVLSRSLVQCGCLRSAYGFIERGLKAAPSDSELLNLRRKIIKTYNSSLLKNDPNWNDWSYNPKTELPEQGHARRELYSWNYHEPDRFSEEGLCFLNKRMKQVAPKCEVRIVSLPILEKDGLSSNPNPSSETKQLGIFATEDIAPHDTVLQETSLLAANNRLHDPLCNACSAPLPPISASQPQLPTCLECDDIIFCSQYCHDAAMSRYHPAVCGKPDLETIAKDPSPLAATNALYLHLLGRTFALSEAQNIHPLDLPETKYLWGDFAATLPTCSSYSGSQTGRALPFTFEDNILAPIHLLQKMDIDIFTSLPTTDIWVLNTLSAKFRGVASARMDPRTGMPQLCAVHPMWCLANHSCAPNVKWEWLGDMKLIARGGDDVVRWGGMRGGQGGIRKGEEVLSHYCDVELGLQERREWANGALGGVCICERCAWEEREGRGREMRQKEGGKSGQGYER
ncbi:MAG: hypothetical protein Q9170_003863 [Blastenia crenularia]